MKEYRVPVSTQPMSDLVVCIRISLWDSSMTFTNGPPNLVIA